MCYKHVVRDMGKKVVVSAEFRRVFCEDDERIWVAAEYPEDEVRTGWIVGCRWLSNGKYYPASGGYYSSYGAYDSYEPAYLSVKSKEFAVLVSFWPTLKPVFVPPEYLRLATDEDDEPRPSAYKWTDRDREMMSMMSMDFPRDKRGRWC